MDRVSFGRALGAGAREAARALVKAADAAAAPNPSARAGGAAAPRPNSPGLDRLEAGTSNKDSAERVVRAHRSARVAAKGVRQGSARFGQAVWRPFVKLSGVLWLEVTGVFFGLFAVTAAVGVWKNRADFHAAGPAQERLWLAVGMLVLFGYFMVSSFLRARRRSRG